MMAPTNVQLPTNVKRENMHLHFHKPATAAQLLARLTEVERSLIRAAANDDRLEYLRQVNFASDGIGETDMKEVRDTLMTQYRVNSASPLFGCTWHY